MSGCCSKPMPSRKSSDSGRFHITLPATSANLGSAFDAAALALSIFLKLSAKAAPAFSIVAGGRDREICGQLENHLILTTYREVLEKERKPLIPLALRIENEIPIGKGCGSSAAARLAGVGLANHFGGLRWSDDRIVGEVAGREHHADNAAACWMGGLVIARMAGDGQAQMACITPKGNWPLLLAISDEVLPTEEARGVLPEQYSRTDVVANIQNSMLLLAAFTEGRRDWLASALADRIHQPYRSTLCPLLPALQSLTGTQGISGVALSGAGPSVLIFLNPRLNVGNARKRIREHLKLRGLSAQLITTRISTRGGSPRSRSPR
jgi:homoserine kinase